MAITDAIDTNGTESFLKSLLPPDASKPSDVEVEEKPEEQAEPEAPEEPEADATEPSEESSDEEPEEPKKPAKRYVADDDEVYVKIKVGDDDLEVPVKDLKRLHGQEASLTRKSQHVAEETKRIENERIRYAHKLDTMVKAATEKANQYRQVNLLALSKDPNVSAEMLGALETEARTAFEQEAFLKGEQNEFIQAYQKDRQDQLVAQARETVKVLNDQNSPLHIPNFNQRLHDEMRQFAVEQGVPRQVADNLVDAPSLKIIHMAMSFAKGQKKTATKVVNKSPKKILKTSQPATPKPARQRDQEAAMKQLRQTGHRDDAVNAFMSRWKDADK